MWWLTLRLQRAELILLITLAVAITIPFFLTTSEGRLNERSARADLTIETCPGEWVTFPDGSAGCNWAPSYFYQWMDVWAPGFVGLPIVVAILLAIPVVMQLQSRSYRVAWSQSQRRDRWLLTHLALILGIGLAITLAIIVLMRWWPLTIWGGDWGVKFFDLRGVVNLGWYVLGVGLTLALSTLIRRPLIALVLAVVAFGAIRIGWFFELRPRLIPPREATTAATGFLDEPGAWIVGQWMTRADGTRINAVDLSRICSPDFGDQSRLSPVEQAERSREAFDLYRDCLDANQFMTHYTYHPASRYWPLQFIETGLLVLIGAALIGWTAWYWLRRLE